MSSYHPSPIVLGYRSAQSRRALEVAADLTARLEGHLHVVHVVTLDDYPLSPDGPGWEEQARSGLHQLRAVVRDQLAGSRLAWTYHLAEGDVVHGLAQVAARVNALMVVVGAPATGRSRGWAEVLTRVAAPDSPSVPRLLGMSRPLLVVPTGPRTGTDHVGPSDAPAPSDAVG